MATGVASWSQTAANNASGDSAVNWAEGQSPSSVNDSARAMMASVAKYRDDISGSITTGGTSTAYTVTSNQGFASLSALDKQIIAFVPHVTNTGSPTLNVDGLGAKALQAALTDGTFSGGELVVGTPYIATFYNSLNCFLIHNAGMFTAPSLLGQICDYAGSSSAPNSRFALCYGQAISRATYAGLFNIMGTLWGTGDGSTTFNIPDLRGRSIFGSDNMGGVAANRLTLAGGGVTGAIGNAGGAQSHTLLNAELPATTLTWTSTSTYAPGSISLDTHGATVVSASATGSSNSSVNFGNIIQMFTPNSMTVAVPSFSPTGTISSFGSGTAFAMMPPCAVMSKIMRIL